MTAPAKSLILYSAGQTVTEVTSVDGKHTERMVKLVGHDEDICWTQDGKQYLRETGAGLNGGVGYRAIHTPGYEDRK